MNSETEMNKIKNELQDVIKSLILLTKSSNQLPESPNEYVLSQSYQSVTEATNSIKSMIYSKIRHLSNYCQLNVDVPSYKMYLADSSNSDNLMSKIIDINDDLVSRSNRDLDIVFKRNIHSVEPKQDSAKTSNSSNSMSKYNYVFMNTLDIPKPQVNFKRKITNDTEPYIPKLNNKPNSLIDIVADTTALVSMIKNKYSVNVDPHHPYLYEIYMFNPSLIQFDYSKPVIYRSIEQTPLVFIDTYEELYNFSINLKQETEFGFDLESHSVRSYQGFTCLLQITTRAQDIIIDTIALHDYIHILNDVFTDPNIVKIGHGTEHDIIWLQRDFDIFVVNLFDTQKALQTINGEIFSLSNAVQSYFGIILNKQYQLADWRQRPLTNEMINYARSDSHYLLPLFDHLIGQLKEKENDSKSIIQVFNDCKYICIRSYQKPVFTPVTINSHYKRIRSNERRIHECFNQLNKWRDELARKYDESPQHILPKSKLYWACNNIHKDSFHIIDYIKKFVGKDVKVYEEEIYRILEKAKVWEEHDWDEEVTPFTNNINPPNVMEQISNPISFRKMDEDRLFELISEIKPYAVSDNIKNEIDKRLTVFPGYMIYKNIEIQKIQETSQITPKNIVNTATKTPIIHNIIQKANPVNAPLEIKLNQFGNKRNKTDNKIPKNPVVTNIRSINSSEQDSFDYSSFSSKNFTNLPNSTENPIKHKRTPFKKKKRP